MNILITTLGKGSRDHDGYRETQYQLDGKVSRKTPFVGFALLELIPAIDKLIVLGTAGSIWDAWWQADETLLEQHGDILSEIGTKVKAECEDEALLTKLGEILEKHIGKKVECKYIPSDVDERSQMDILQVMNQVGDKGDSIYLDVTHGFRYLPMIELLSAFLKKNECNIQHIYYGAFEKSNDGIAPIVELKGLLQLQEWIEAMAVLRETGNVMPLTKISSMQPFKIDFEQYQFFVQMNNVGNARGCANRIRGMINKDKLPPEGVLFKDELLSYFDWGADQDYARRQLAQAKAALTKGDFLRAVILLNEAAISVWVEDPAKAMDVEQRNVSEERLFKYGGDKWHLLRRLRNSLAHDGAKNDWYERKIKKLRSSRDEFLKGVKDLVQWVETLMR